MSDLPTAQPPTSATRPADVGASAPSGARGAPTAHRQTGRIARGPRTAPWTLAVGLTLALTAVLLWFGQHDEPPPAATATVPAWSLTDQNGAAWGSAQLAGRPWVASFFFTSCETICPKILGAMGQLQTRIASDQLPLQLVSISVDPAHDAPESLRETAAQYGVDARYWRLMTGSEAAVRALVVDGFRTWMGEAVRLSDDLIEIGHGARLVLVDGQGGVRGHFDATTEGTAELLAQARALTGAP